MKGGFILFLFVFCYVDSVKCYGGKGYDPLGKFMKAQRFKKSRNHVTNYASSTVYSPVCISSQEGLKEADEISLLPGQPKVNFSQYSGYVTVDPTAGRALFYYFAESEEPSSKPLVLWLNGGPGCSSIGSGAMTENGPFRVNPDGKTLWYNKYAWNNVANVLYLESPAGVGFSYSNTTSDYVTGDKRTAADSYTFLVNWLDRFPEYKTRDFFITGESYAGHYVPQLADLILENNKITNQTVINLKGIAIGNAYIDYTDRWTGTYDHYWTSALISDETHQGIISNCNFSSSDFPVSDSCSEYEDQADTEIGNVYVYDVYAPLCGSPSTAPSISNFDPCSDDYVNTYLNTKEIQAALHVTGIPVSWADCNYAMSGEWQDEPDTVLPVIKKLMASGITVWIYSGDTDNIIPVTTTRYSFPKLGAPVKTPWYPWYYQGEVGGYVVGYQNVTFVTIRGAGHFVPSYQPGRALAFFTSFLNGNLPPSHN
ncbi:serine carboxypeptidase 1-like [Primulina tabacum]|uniref:serine carboxypeptidase 1-like n=1 Tax=Primulina tabacum TaxID=48773 RepID=UPI003F5AA9BA